MVNYLEKLLCIEILEKITRMQRFLRLEPDVSRRQGFEVVNIFLKALDAILVNLRPIITRLSEKVPLDKWEKLATIRRLSDTFKSIDNLHSQLQFVYGIWVRPEAHVFVKSVIEFIPSVRRPEKVNIILSNMYSFLETDLSSYVEDVLSVTDIYVDFQNQSPSVFLPKIERDNPLNWSILVHECGHADFQGNSHLLDQLEAIFAQADAPSKKILQRWAEEIYCDLFATQILGPAYLASFATFALVVAGGGGSEISSETHPADIVRIAIIHEALEKSNLKVVLAEPRLDSNDISSLFYNALEERVKLERQFIRPPLEQPQPQFILQDFVDVICEQVEQTISLSQQLTVKDFDRIYGLAKRLAKGILIGSYQNPQLMESGKENFSEGRIDPQKLNEAKTAVQESRVLLWEIVNAGWLHKIENIYPRAFTLFFDSDDTPLEERVRIWGEELEGIDRLLLKSIESSEIQRLMEEV